MELIFKKSIVTDDLKHCYECGESYGIEIHHVFFGRNRKNADKDGCVVPLCKYHHTGLLGVHGKKGEDLDTKLKKLTELKWLEYNNATIEDFIKRYRINYL